MVSEACSPQPFRHRSRHLPAGVFSTIAVCLLVAGCAGKEHRYTARNLPPRLLADRWEAPCTVDLSHAAARRPPGTIEPGDTVEVTLASGLRSTEMNRVTTKVADDGTVALPVVGRITVAGAPPESAGNAVIQACHETGVKQPPFVEVALREPRQNRISVVGAVPHPGSYTLPRHQSDLVSALAAAGGLGRDSGEKIVIQHHPAAKAPAASDVQLADFNTEQEEPRNRRPTSAGPTRQEIPLSAAATTKLPRAELNDGDVVFVEQRDPPSVLVTGTVHHPGRYDFPVGQDFRVLDAIARAQGIPNKVVDTVVVCRQVSGEEKTVLIEVSLHEATRAPEENLRLMPGDIVSVEPTPGSLMKDGFKYVGTALAAGIGFARR